MVKCKDCGYFALEDLDSLEIREANKKFRDTCQLPTHNQPKVRFNMPPICTKQVIEFSKKVVEAREEAHKERDCDGIYQQWIPGLLPKEHDEMSLLEQVKMLNAESRRVDLATHAESRRVDLEIQAKSRKEDLQRQDKFEDRIDVRFKQSSRSLAIWTAVSIVSVIVTSIFSVFVIEWLKS